MAMSNAVSAPLREVPGHPAAGWGRGGDTKVAHVMEGEMMVPPVISPALRAKIKQELASHGIDLDEHTVGQGMSINPITGLPEFGFGKAFKKIKKVVKKIAASPIGQIALPVLGATVLPGIGLGISSAVGGAIGSGVATAAAGGSWGQILGSAAGSYIGGAIGGPGSGTVGSNMNQAGLLGYTRYIPSSVLNTSISATTGAFLGSSLGNAAGAMLDPPKQPSSWGSEAANMPGGTDVAGGNTGGVAIPTGGAGAGTSTVNVNQPTGSGVNYTTQVRDRDTGQMRSVNTPFANNWDRRNGWGNGGVSFA